MIAAKPFLKLGIALSALAAPALAFAQVGTQAASRAAPQPAGRQTAAQPTGGLDLPADVRLLGNSDPNTRTATALVNGQVITGTDIDQRTALIVAANKTEIPAEEQQRLRMQVFRNLIDETLQIQAARSEEITITPADIDNAYRRVASQQFGQDTAAMDRYLRSINSSPTSLKRQIEGELAWQRLLRRNVQPYVNVSDEEVNELMARLQASKGTEEYRLGEIYLAATPTDHDAVEQNARQIVDQLKQGGSFLAYARQYSQASTASVGGDLGFVRLGVLPGELSTVVREMQPGQLVGPIDVPGGLSIVYLIDKRQILTADPRDAILSLKQISLDFPAGIARKQAETKLANFSQTLGRMRGCGDAEAVAQEIGATVVSNDQIRARSLPTQLQDAMLQLQIGQVTPPFGSAEEGVRALMLCGRDDPQVDSGPDFEQLMAQLEDDRVNKRAQRYLRDLRDDAIIEYN